MGTLYAALAPRLLRRSDQLAGLLPALPAPATAALSLLVGLTVPAELRRRVADAVAEGGVLLGGLSADPNPNPNPNPDPNAVPNPNPNPNPSPNPYPEKAASSS